MIPTQTRTRKLFAAGKIGPRTRCVERAHLGPMIPPPDAIVGWLGLTWMECQHCGSTVSVGGVAA